jgi:hypothetical protein
LSVIAGTGEPGAPDRRPATESDIGSPTDVAVDTVGNVDVSDGDNAEIERVNPAGDISVIASGELFILEEVTSPGG